MDGMEVVIYTNIYILFLATLVEPGLTLMSPREVK